MDGWSKWTEFLACGLFVLPAMLGFGLDSFEAFAVTLALLQVALITVALGAPTVEAPAKDEERQGKRPD